MTGVLTTLRAGDPGLVVVGGGIAGLRTVQTVRSAGYTGRVTVVAAERHLPYDRPPLSKQVLTGELAPEAPVYHGAEYFADLGIDLMLGQQARRLDVERRVLHVGDAGGGELTVPYSAVVIATGARPRRLPCAEPPEGVHVVRTVEDAAGLRAELLTGPQVAVVGAGFIGAEVASSARALGLDVTVIESAASPLARAIGQSMGDLLGGLHARNGVRLVCGRGVTGLHGTDRVEGLLLDDGTSVAADLVVVGVGVVPDVEWLADSGLPLDDGVACDEYLRAGRSEVLGAGDAVSWPNRSPGRDAYRTRSQQWTTAGDQGRHVAEVLVYGADAAGPFEHDLYFWSDQYGVKIQGAGLLNRDAALLELRPDRSRLVAAYRDADRLGGVLTVNHPKEFRRLRALAAAGAPWSQIAPREMSLADDLSGGDAA
ncbi:NAD(P)/FAD-dependent oxidoreductase [Geodermatophilus ruber]|uniref:Reductase C-terminal n=1 Tax=Geodermatophilus ruber TaxID=504800 RepID=A0A1I4KLW0_9ACTN|nr:FAD-dependent oxidoreductase [Geodermatophilus ruber]SFL79553.1 Reductase C-terminal [Geodermatophilus ruber]